LIHHFQPEEAEPVARRAVNLARPIASGRSIYLAFGLDTLSQSLYWQGRWADSLSVAQESVEVRRSIEGEHHDDYGGASEAVAWNLARLGRCDEAVALARGLNDVVQSSDPRHWQSAYRLWNLCFILIRCGQPAEAESLTRARYGQLTATIATDQVERRGLG